MNVRRIIGSLVATTLAATSLTLVATTSPAAAATKVTIISGTSSKPWLYPSYKSQPGAPTYGDSLSVSINVTAPGTQTVYAGTVSVQRRLAGQSWKTILRSQDAYLYKTIKAAGNASYRVIYSGGSNYQGTFAPAVSSIKSLKTQRKLTTTTLSGRHAGFKGKVSPAKKVKIVVFKKKHGKYKKYKSLRANRKGKFTVILPAPRSGRYNWKIVFKGDAKFAPSTIKGWTRRT
ncbi:hypothetical protein [Nocardioides sp. URHA0020]|uniref:hypothetical protein n=1 Tax=Nocardioides sp. URHA0020 TaxID=1380392 RepID=UPI00048AAC9E|nr:hypothetical protein [Nocardioides sp. URHA0020]